MASPTDHIESPAPSPDGCSKACCASDLPVTDSLVIKNDESCQSEHAHVASAEDACCSNSLPTREPPAANTPALPKSDCCGDAGKGKPAGCDEKCIETAAALECEAACEKEATSPGDDCCGNGGDKGKAVHCTPDEKHHTGRHLQDHTSGSSMSNKHQHQHGDDGQHLGKACSDHLRAAFDKYTSYLESARCICKSVIASHVDTCCGNPGKNSASGRPDGVVSVGQSTGRQSEIPNSNKLSSRRGMKHQHEDPKSVDCHSHRFSDDCHPEPRKSTLGSDGIVAKNDLEKGAGHEHVVFNVGGMDCSGCGNKLTRSLEGINGTSNVQVVFVTGFAELDLDTKITTVEEVILKAERATGLHCSRVISDNQTLDVLVDSLVAKRFSRALPRGVTAVDAVDKKTHRITFDPIAIGARSVLASIEGAKLAPPGQDTAWTEGRVTLLKMSFKTLLAAILTLPIIVLAWADTPVPYSTRSIVSLVLGTLVQAVAIPEFYSKAIKSLLYNRIIEMDMLVVISISAAYGYSVVAFGLTRAGYVLETQEFFETSTLLITLVLFGRLIAAIARMKAVAAVSLRSLQVEKALLVDQSGETTELDARLLQFGDTISIPPHSQIVTDAEITHGSSAVDESMITGESLPVPRAVGDCIIAGTVNGPGTLTARLTRLPGKNSITDIANLVENAYSSKPRVQDLADRVAGWFIPVVTTIAVIVLIIWVIVGLKVRGSSGGGAVGLAITYSIAVLAVSCPCALGLAVPMVLVITGGVAARAGVIIKQADATEKANKVTDVVFDKTGTLTQGNLEVVSENIMTTAQSSSTIHSIVKSLVRDNVHPVSLAVASALQNKASILINMDDIQSNPGEGITASWNGASVKAGNPYWLQIEQVPEVATLISRGLTLLCVTLDSEILVAFGMKSNIRKEAHVVVEELQRRGIQTHIVSGDAPKAVEDVAHTVKIALENVASRRSPADKQKYVHDLMAQGKVVLFCGDGTNDAVAIAQASVGVQIGSSSDITRATADVILLSGLDGILTLIDLSKAAYRRMIFNFAWSAIYNVLAILLAAGAFVKIRIEPAYAGLGEIVSVLPVIIAALTILKTRKVVKS